MNKQGGLTLQHIAPLFGLPTLRLDLVFVILDSHISLFGLGRCMKLKNRK